MAQQSFFSERTSTQWACDALLAGRKISTQIQIQERRGWRLGAIVHRLRDEFAWPILDKRGAGRVKTYWLDPDADLTKLNMPRSAQAATKAGCKQ